MNYVIPFFYISSRISIKADISLSRFDGGCRLLATHIYPNDDLFSMGWSSTTSVSM